MRLTSRPNVTYQLTLLPVRAVAQMTQVGLLMDKDQFLIDSVVRTVVTRPHVVLMQSQNTQIQLFNITYEATAQKQINAYLYAFIYKLYIKTEVMSTSVYVKLCNINYYIFLIYLINQS